MKAIKVLTVIFLFSVGCSLSEEKKETEEILENNNGYLGTYLPADFKAFSDDSPWRVPIETNPEVDSNSDEMIAFLKIALEDSIGRPPNITVGYSKWTAPIHVVNSDECQKVDVPIERDFDDGSDIDGDGIADDLPIPDCVWPDPENDAHMVIVDTTKRIAWEFWHFRKISNGEFEAGTMGKWDLNGPGYNIPGSSERWWRNGTTGAKTAYIGGLLRYEEFASGEVKHALNIITPINRKKISEDAPWRVEFCSPVAASSDGWGIGSRYIPEGARIQLNPELDLDSLGLNEDAKVIAKALQTYGAYVMDNGAGFEIKAQNLGADGGAWINHTGLNLYLIPLEEFRVLKGNIITF